LRDQYDDTSDHQSGTESVESTIAAIQILWPLFHSFNCNLVNSPPTQKTPTTTALLAQFSSNCYDKLIIIIHLCQDRK